MLRRLLFATCLFSLLTSVVSLEAAETREDSSQGPVYELRIYTCEPNKLNALQERFRNHTMRLFEKHGMRNLAYWTPVDGPAAGKTLIYLLEHPSRKAAEESWRAFRADPEWITVAKDSQIQHGKILAQPPKSVFLATTDYSPEVDLPPADRIFELRTYTAAPGKLEALHSRFRDHTDRLFQKHGMTAYGYWKPLDAPQSEDTLIYVLSFENREAAQASWDAFRNDSDWKRVFAESQKDGSLTAKRPESLFMELADISPVAQP